jgi:hypothetical protein
MKKNTRNIFIALLILGVISLTPLTSQAFWGFGDIALDPVQDESGIATQISQVTQVIGQVEQLLKAFGLDVVIYKVSQQLSQKLIAKVLNKANGGASGDQSKQFINNFGQYFSDISNQQIGVFTNSLNNSSNPFAQAISVGISNNAQNQSSSSTELDSFSLDKILPSGNNWQDATKDISSAGGQGWDIYGAMALPQNTPLGSAIIAQDILSKQITSAQNNAKTELGSSGFTPAKSQGGIGQFLQNSGQESFSSVNTDGNIQTPTQTNQDQAGQTVQESFDRLRSADSFGKILFNTIQQLTMGLIQKGFSSLSSDGGAQQKLYGGPRDVTTSLGAQNASWSSTPQQVVDFRSNLDAGVTKTALEIKFLNQTINSVRKPVVDETIVNLEACIPGPDTGFDRRLSDYMTAQTQATQRRAGDSGDKGQKNSDALTTVRQNVQQAIAEEKALVANPFLNIPGAEAMQSALNDYYKTAKRFRGLIDQVVTKQQILNNLQVLRAEAQAVGTSANNGTPFIILDSQWNALTPTQQSTLYTQLSPAILRDFPQYADRAVPGQLSALPAALTDAQWNAKSSADKQILYSSLAANILVDFPQYADLNDNTHLSALPGLITDDVWTAMSQDQKNSLYAQLKSNIVANFPQYRDPNNSSSAIDLPQVITNEIWTTLSDSQKTQLYTNLTPGIINDFPEYKSSSDPTQLSALPTVLTDAQWNALSPTRQDQIYNSLTAGMIQHFKDYIDPTDITKVLAIPQNSTTDTKEIRVVKEQTYERDLEMENRIVSESPLARDAEMRSRISLEEAHEAGAGAGDIEMKKRVFAELAKQSNDAMKTRVFDEQWNEWEAKVPNATKQQLYARYISLTRDISDSSSVQNAQVKANGAIQETKALGDVLSDCKKIKSHLLSTPNPRPDDTAFIQTLKYEGIRDSYSGPSILSAAANGIDFETLNQRLIGTTDGSFGGQLQVPSLAKTVTDVINQDRQGSLFCRLMTYEMVYWIPKDLTGYPIPCYPIDVPLSPQLADGSNVAEHIVGKPATWYHTNNGEILYKVTDNQN